MGPIRVLVVEQLRARSLAVDVSAVRRPGVYVLLRAGRAVFIGAARKLESRLYAHSIHRRGDFQPGLPREPIEYDQILIYPCTVDDLAEVRAQAAREHGL